MKKIIAITVAMAMLGIASIASASSFSITFTADNILTDFTISTNGGTAVAVDGFSTAANLDEWRASDSLNVDLVEGNSYELIWRVENVGAASDSNPFAFLADVSSTWTSTMATDATWEVATEVGGTPGTWTSATVYAYNSGLLADGSGTSIWYNSLGSGVSGISDAAAWIGSDDYPGNESNAMYVRMSFTATPIPAAAWLMGSGLLGLLGVRRFGFSGRK